MVRDPSTSRSLQVDSTLQARAELLLDDLMRSHPLKVRPVIIWRPFRVAAGKADFRAHAILLSAIVLVDEEKMEVTLKHEYAHLLAYDRVGNAALNHGAPWRQAMADLGEKPEVYHRYEVSRNTSRQTVIYRCTKCQSEFGLKRRLNRRKRYLHTNCGGGLQLVRIERK